MIIVKVCGYTGAGKTCVTNIINNALREHGFKDITVRDEDYSPDTKKHFDKIIDVITARETPVIIETIQMHRASFDDRPILPR